MIIIPIPKCNYRRDGTRLRPECAVKAGIFAACLCMAAAARGAAIASPAAGFDLQGHRGARGLAPENTLAGFRRALEIGVTTLEFDVGSPG